MWGRVHCGSAAEVSSPTALLGGSWWGLGFRVYGLGFRV